MRARILIVDNEKAMLSVLRLILTRNKYEVVEATSGQEALDIIQQSQHPDGDPIDLVLLDIMMPDISGIDVCQAIRQQEGFATLPIMMLTALGSVSDRLLAFDVGADDYLIKPVDHRELLARVQIQLRLRLAERDARRRNRELVALHTVADVLNRSLDLNSILSRTLAVSCDVLQIESGAIYLVDANREFANLVVSRGISNEFVQHPDIASVAVGERNVGKAAATGKAFAVTDLHTPLRPTLELVKREGVRSAAYVPIKDETQIVGVLAAATHTLREFHEEEIALLETVGAQLGGTIARARLHEEVEAARDQARALARAVVEAQESERQRIARELHDQLGQATTALKLDLELLRDSLDPGSPELDARLSEDIDIASAILAEIQTLSLELRPAVLDDLGLEPALRWYADRFVKRTGLAVDLRVQGIGESDPRLPEDVETVVFRCLQEILTNVARHAKASHVFIEIARDNSHFSVTARDDGIGFDVDDVLDPTTSPYAFGLNGTHERAALVGGTCAIKSEPGIGTEIKINVPLDNAGP